MYNWSVDEKKFKKEDPERYRIWRQEQMINYGLGGEKLDAEIVKKHWDKIFMDGPTRRYLEFLLWPRRKKSICSPFGHSSARRKGGLDSKKLKPQIIDK